MSYSREPAVSPLTGPIAPSQSGPIAPPLTGPIASSQSGPIAPSLTGPIASSQPRPIAPSLTGPIASSQSGPAAPSLTGKTVSPPTGEPAASPRSGPADRRPSPPSVFVNPSAEPLISWIEPVLILDHPLGKVPETAMDWMKNFEKIRVVSPGPPPEEMPPRIQWHALEEYENPCNVWNRILAESAAPWVLFLKEGEQVNPTQLPSLQELKSGCWIPALIQWKEQNSLRQCYQFRLIPGSDEAVFTGVRFPDATPFLLKHAIEVSDRVFTVIRSGNPYEKLNESEELAAGSPSAQIYLALGMNSFSRGNYVLASGQFRKVLTMPQIMPWDRYAARNGLASCMAEQYKWAKAAEMAFLAIDEEPRQYLPYLILYRIHEMGKRWADALEHLQAYYHQITRYSRAAFDRRLPEETTLKLLAGLAFKAGDRRKAFNYYQKLHEYSGGQHDSEVLRRLLLFSIELSESSQAERYFMELYSEVLKGRARGECREDLCNYLALFMKQGWYDFVSKTYEDLLKVEPENETYIRGWLVSLSKSSNISEAKNVINALKKRKKTG